MPLLERLEQYKGYFGARAAAESAALLERVEHTRFRDAEDLIRLHEVVLYLRAYPQSARVLRLADETLFAFGRRLTGIEREPFEYADVSGIAGTGLTTNFSFPFAKSLVERHGAAVSIDWGRWKHPDRLAPVLAKLISEAFEDWAIAPHADWRRLYEHSRMKLPQLMAAVSPLVYDLLELPLRWELGDSAATRSRARVPRRRIFYHGGAFLTRKDLSLEQEFRRPMIRTRRLGAREAQRVMDVIVDASAVRYRELYGFLYPDLARVFHADLGRGVDFYYFGVPRKWRLPKRTYHGGMYFKNGVPIGYVEVMSLGGRMEVGFNLYYTFRQGETAWLYARLLKLFRERLGGTSSFVPPYHLGNENDEAIESGAFWFYYKLGFRPESPAVAALAEREAIRARAAVYRTSAKMLRKLARSALAYEPPRG